MNLTRRNGEDREMTAEELAQLQMETQAADREYWTNISYDEAVHVRIRERYSESQEFAILRQKDEKPEEYENYYAYCEACKDYAKKKKEEFYGS